MSVRMIQAVKEMAGGTPTQRFIAWVLADCHNEKTGRCDPSAEYLCSATGFSNRTIWTALEGLEKAGHITADRRKGGHNSYKLHPLACEPPSHVTCEPPSQDEAPQPVNLTTVTCEPVASTCEPVAESCEPPSQEPEVTGKRTGKKPIAAVAADDPRHHDITSQIGAVYEKSKGSKFAFNGRFAKSLKTFLTGWKGTSDEYLDRYHDCLRLSKEQFAGKCRNACDPCFLCDHWLAVCAEIDSFDNPPPRKAGGFKNSI